MTSSSFCLYYHIPVFLFDMWSSSGIGSQPTIFLPLHVTSFPASKLRLSWDTGPGPGCHRHHPTKTENTQDIRGKNFLKEDTLKNSRKVSHVCALLLTVTLVRVSYTVTIFPSILSLPVFLLELWSSSGIGSWPTIFLPPHCLLLNSDKTELFYVFSKS